MICFSGIYEGINLIVCNFENNIFLLSFFYSDQIARELDYLAPFEIYLLSNWWVTGLCELYVNDTVPCNWDISFIEIAREKLKLSAVPNTTSNLVSQTKSSLRFSPSQAESAFSWMYVYLCMYHYCTSSFNKAWTRVPAVYRRIALVATSHSSPSFNVKHLSQSFSPKKFIIIMIMYV